jgi:hypothetical protein
MNTLEKLSPVEALFEVGRRKKLALKLIKDGLNLAELRETKELDIFKDTQLRYLAKKNGLTITPRKRGVKVGTVRTKVIIPKIDLTGCNAGSMTENEFKACVDNFILENGSDMTNSQLTENLMKIYPVEYSKYADADNPRMVVAGRISRMKRLKFITKRFLLDDRQKSKSKAQRRKDKETTKLEAYFETHKNVVTLLQKRVKYTLIEELCGISYTTVMNVKAKMTENRHMFQTYNNGDSEIKDTCRSIVIDYMLEHSIIGKMLTLPSSNVTFERRVIDEISQYMTFDAVEYDSKVFMDMIAQFTKLSILDRVKSLHNCKVGEMIGNAKANEYAHAFLDYCGTLSKHEYDVKTAMDNKIVMPKGVLAFTFCLSHDYGTKLKNLVGHIETKDEQSFTYSAIETYFKNNIGNTYKLKEMYQYLSKNNQPMVLVVLKRIR